MLATSARRVKRNHNCQMFKVARHNGGVDAAARIQSSIAGPVKLRNTLPPLASNELLAGVLTSEADWPEKYQRERRWFARRDIAIVYKRGTVNQSAKDFRQT